MYEGELFVSGRAKDVILVRGKSFHAEDLESSASQADAQLIVGGCAAVAVDGRDEEQFWLFLEIDPRRAAGSYGASYEKILDAARASVTRQHGIVPAALYLVKRGALPRTSSGKLMRFACRNRFSAGKLSILAQWPSTR
jgi:acyl-CoA synthetase (AMP-forming)/AMP-acid ligase II